MWDTRETSSSSIMGVLFIIIIIWAIFGGGLFGNRAAAAEYGMCRDQSNCDVEKQTIINTATTQNLINENANRQIEAANANTQRLYDQSARQWEAQLQETILDSKLRESTTAILNSQALAQKDSEIALLKGQMYTDAKFDVLGKQLSDLACNVPQRPPYFAQGFVTCGQPIPTGCC